MPELNQRPGISAATLAALDIRHVSQDEAFDLLGQRYSGLYIPYGVYVEGKPFGRLRLDQPQDGRKYTQRIGSGVHPYIPSLPGLETQDDLVIIEGEFKAIALCEAEFRAIGISGFYGFAHEGQLCVRLEKHLKDHPPRRILFVGDNDTALNFQFSDAAMKLARLVDPVPVALPRIPLSMPKGADDCREKLGADEFRQWWQKIVVEALGVPAKLNADLLAAELFKLAVPELRTMTGIERAMVLQKLGKLAACLQPMARGELADLCKNELGINKSVLQHAAAVAMAENSTPRTTKEEWKATAELYGTPVFYGGKDNEFIIGLNERFWAGLIKEQHLLLHEPDEKMFYRYDESCGLWRPESRALLEQLVCDTVLAESDGDPEYLKYAQFSFARAGVGHLQGMTEKRGAFAGDPCGIHVANGYLVIGPDAIELHDFSPHYYSRNQSPIAFDPDARCPMFMEKVLQPALDPDDIGLLQYLAGQFLLGRNLMQAVLILVGPGGASKGTISNIIQSIIGEDNCYELRTEHLEERFELFRYIGKTLLYGADVEPEFLRHYGARALKKLVGGDLLSPEGKNSNAKINLRGIFNVVITTNKKLSVRLSGDVSAWRRRLRIIEFKQPAAGRPVIVNFDRMLVEKEGAGILNWAVMGAAQVLADKRAGRTRPLSAVQQERIDALLGQSDSMRLFLELSIERRPGEALEKNDVLEAYGDFCGERKWEPLPDLSARKELNNRMLELFGSVERKSAGGSHNHRGYSNVAFKEQ